MNLLDLAVKVAVKDEATSEIDSLSNSLTGKLGSAAKKVGVALAGAFAADKVVQFGQAAIDTYSSYEQLSGGIETLFKKSANTIEKYAADAYETAGISANSYMQTATSFSASLISSLGGDTAKASEYTNRAIVDMADNANKMGTSMEEIQNAYQSLSRGNYAMLDSLKLGYGGTKSELERLISDAAKMTDTQEKLGVTVDSSSTSFDNIINAISVMQTELGIAGATHEEAAYTIEGSVNSMAAAWANLVTSFSADKDDFMNNVDDLAQKFVDSVGIAATNVIPAVGRMIVGIGEALVASAPTVAEKAGEMLAGVVDFAKSFDWASATDDVISTIGDLVLNADWEGIISNAASALLDASGYILESVGSIITSVIDYIGANSDRIAGGFLSVMLTAAVAIVKAAPRFVAQVGALIGRIAIAIAGAAGRIASSFGQLIGKGLNAVKDKVGAFVSAGRNIVEGLKRGIASGAAAIRNLVLDIAKGAEQAIKNFFGIKSPSRLMMKYGRYISEGLAIGIEDGGSKAVSAMLDVSRGITAAAPMPIASAASATGGIVINLNYNADADANKMLLDIANGITTARMAGAI